MKPIIAMTNGAYPFALDGEEWRDVLEFPGRYMVSDLGRVVSLHRGKHCILQPTRINSGYLQLRLCKDGRRYNRLVHRISVEAFYGPKPGRPQENPVHHRDGDRTNNRRENIEWSTPTENNRARMISGNNSYKLSYDLADEMRALRSAGWTYKALMAKYGVSKSTVWSVLTDKIWFRSDGT